MNEIDQVFNKINTSPYMINEDLINFKQPTSHQLSLSDLLSPDAITIHSDKGSTACASNEQYLLKS
jgi:hypothetical protein